jgi:hypothetical protein
MKHLLISLPLLLFFSNLNAQQSYATISAGYGFGTGGIVHPMFEQSTISGNNLTVVGKKLMLGEGLFYRGDVRAFFNEYVGAGVQFSLHRGSWQHFSSDRKIVYVQRVGRAARVRGFSLAGSLHLRTGDYNVVPYLTISPGFFRGTMDLMDTISYSGIVTSSQWEYQNMNSLFCNFATGIDMMINKELNVFAEFEFQNMTVSPQKARLIKRNGSIDLEEIPVSEKVILFPEKITTDYTQMPDDNKPKQELKPYFPIDHFQIRIGVRVLLGG